MVCVSNFIRSSSILVALLLFAFSSHAQEATEKQQQDQLRKILNDSFEEFEIKTNTDQSVTKGEIVFRWDNRERGSADGCTALWYDKERRPIAVASVYPWRGNLVHEFDLVDRRSGAVGKRNGAIFWRPANDAVLRFEPIPNAQEPATSNGLRRIQIKSIASQFSVEMTGWKADRSDREKLRMLPTPVHRYSSDKTDADLLDGAFFLFVKGTDPEAGLLLEAHKHENSHRWEYSFIPQTSGSLEAKFKKKVVWTKRRNEESNSHGSTATRLPAELQDL